MPRANFKKKFFSDFKALTFSHRAGLHSFGLLINENIIKICILMLILFAISTR